MKKTKGLGTCVICNKRAATTRDHVPPKGIFCQPRPTNLITVPACSECNHGASEHDKRFKIDLGLHVSGSGGKAEEFFRREAIKTLKKNRKLLQKILSQLEPVYLQTKGGIIYDRGYRCRWNSEAHDAIVERIIRGLYYRHFRDILGDQVRIRVQWFKELTPEMIEMSNDWSVYSFGQGEVTYRFGRADEGPLNSVWIFQFYGAHWAGGYTEPITPELPPLS